MMGSGALAIAEEEKSALETSKNEASSKGSSVKQPEVALEWNNMQIKFRVVGQDFQTNNLI